MGELVNPLQNLISKAAKSLPATTGETERARQEGERIKARCTNSTAATILLCDVSSSMSESAGSRTKIETLRDAVSDVWTEIDGGVLLTFSDRAQQVESPRDIPSPNGGTALHLGLRDATAFRPLRTIVVSDGQPDSESDALEAAAQLPGIIDVIYCGPDSDRTAIDFMQRLARCGGGRVVIRDLRRVSAPELTTAVRGLLPRRV